MASTAESPSAIASLADQLFDICQNVVDGKSTPEEAFERISSHHDACPQTCTALLDVLTVVEGETAGNADVTAKFNDFLKLLSDTIIPDEVLRAELDSMEANTQANKTQIVRTKTKLFFKQSKFNLLREESEGWAKLLTELLSVESEGLTIEQLRQRVLQLIGTFNLDPNRVTDILLEALERLPSHRDIFVGLLKEQGASSQFLLTLLARKFAIYQTSSTPTPFSLYALAAGLIQEGLVPMEEMGSYLTPRIGELLESHKARAAKASVRSKKAESIASGATVDNKSSAYQGGEVEPTSVTGVAFSVVAGQQEAEDAKLRGDDENEDKVLGENQKIGLACALLEDFAWEQAKRLLNCMPEFYAVQASKRACCAIADMVDAAIADIYAIKCAQGLSEGTRRKERRPWEKKVSGWADFEIVFELLSYLGPRIAARPRTLTKLVRLTAVFYEEKAAGAHGATEEMANRLMDVLDESLLPALSLAECNVALSEEVWTLLRGFSYTQRYRLYGRWKSLHTSRHPELLIEKGKTLGKTKYVLKRLSKDTVKMMGRIIGKLAHTHPVFVFEYLLERIQMFENLIHPVVDALRFLTNMELDVLLFVVLEQLASSTKNSLKASDGMTSQWLSALATLVGALLKRYTVDLAGILHYVANTLRMGKSSDLVILNEMLLAMGSVDKQSQATQEHIEAASGGEILRVEAGSYAAARNKRATTRLKDAILQDDMAVGLCILVSQMRDAVIFESSDDIPLKLTADTADQCRDTLVQLTTFLLENVKVEEYLKMMPSLSSLLDDFHVPLETAFHLARPAFMHQVYAEFDRSKRVLREKDAAAGGEKTKMDTTLKMAFFNSAIDVVVTRLGEQLRPRITGLVNAEISMQVFVLFWMLSPYDLEVPVEAYDREAERIKKAIGALPDNIEMGKTRRAKEEERLRALDAKLREEQRRQTEHVERVRAYLRAEKDKLFASGIMHTMLQQCILPRSMFSEADAAFAAKFVLLLHANRTANFQTVLLLDKLFGDVLPVLSALSESEANAVGRLMQVLMSQAARWFDDKELFEKECEGSPGFTIKTKQGASKQTGLTGNDTFGRLLHKFQLRLVKAFHGVLTNQAAEYTHTNNCIIALTKMLPCFPLVADHVEPMEAALQALSKREQEGRRDLSLKAASCAGQLKTRKVGVHAGGHYGVKAVFRGSTGTAPAGSTAPSSSPAVNGRAIKKEPGTEKATVSAKKEPSEKLKEVKKEPIERAERDEAATTPKATTKSSTSTPTTKSTEDRVKRVKTEAKEGREGREKEKKEEKERKEDKEIKEEPPEEGERTETPTNTPPKKLDRLEQRERERAEARILKEKEKKEERAEKNGEEKKETTAIRKKTSDGGGVARALLLGQSKRGRGEVEKDKEEDTKEPIPSTAASSATAEKAGRRSATTEEEAKRREKRSAEEGEEGEVPPSPPRRKERTEKRNGTEDATAKKGREIRAPKETKEKEKREERREDRVREKEKEDRKKEKDRRDVEGPMPPPRTRISAPSSTASMAEEMAARMERGDRDTKRKRNEIEETSPSVKKAKKERESRERERSSEARGHKTSPIAPASREKERREEKEKERRRRTPERRKETGGSGASRRVHSEITY